MIFFFFGLTNPPRKWIEEKNRDYFGVWEPDQLLNPSNAYKTSDESISTYTIAQSLGIEYDDLPVIILTNNFQFNQYRVVKTCQLHLIQQLTDIGYFCSKKEKYFSLIDDDDFNQLIKSIDLCGGVYQLSNEESLAKTLSDFLAFVVSETRSSNDRSLAENQVSNVINKFLSNKELQSDPKRIEQLNLFILGCLSTISKRQRNELITIDNRCENESKIIFRTFASVYPFFEQLNDQIGDHYFESREIHRKQHSHYNENLDYSPLIMSLCKIFEIETNLSIVHWIRNNLSIEMPEYFKIRKADNNNYTIIPSAEIVASPRPVDFNKGNGKKWVAPGIGESELVALTLFKKNEYPNEISDYKGLLSNWATIRQFRNKAAHTENLEKHHFDKVFEAFTNLNTLGAMSQLNDIKSKYKQL